MCTSPANTGSNGWHSRGFWPVPRISPNPKLPRRLSALPMCLGVAILSIALTGCNKLEKLQDQIDAINKTLNEAQKNATDVGVISELGWLSKILRDSATGTPEEQERARQAVAKLFGMDESQLSQQQFFEVTVQIRDFTLIGQQQLDIDSKYLADVSYPAVKAVFASAPGNAFSPYSARDPEEIRRSPEAIRQLVKERVSSLIESNCGPAGYFMSCDVSFRHSTERAYGEAIRGLPSTTDRDRGELVEALSEAILAPTEVAGLPPAGSFNPENA